MRHFGLREFTTFYLTARLTYLPESTLFLNADPTAVKPLLYRPAMLRHLHGLSPLGLGGRLVHTPDDYLVAVTVFRVVWMWV